MKILSIDVGIKNMAYCLFERPNENNSFNITQWDIIDISESENAHMCCFSKCMKPAKYMKKDICFCLQHAKKKEYKIPTLQQKPSFINKQTIKKLCEIAENLGIKYEPKIKKVDLSNLIKDYLNVHYFDCIETRKASEVNLFNIALNIKKKFNCLFENEIKIDNVIIENQIGPLAIRMKTIQSMIVQYFVMSNVAVDHIESISASNKLKDCDAKDKAKYSDRKKLGIAKCLDILSKDDNFNKHLNYFNQHKKKDDLSDSFLQGMWFISTSTFLEK
jgi:hypothetical protein